MCMTAGDKFIGFGPMYLGKSFHRRELDAQAVERFDWAGLKPKAKSGPFGLAKHQPDT